MNISEKARVKILDCFYIKDKGFVLVSEILEGQLSTGDTISFNSRMKLIKGVGGFSSGSKKPNSNIGILIGTDSDLSDLSSWTPDDEIALVYETI